MARHATMQDQLNTIRRKYKKVSPVRFFYNKPKELKQRYKQILVWFLIHDEQRGHSIFSPRFRVGDSLSVNQWAQRFSAKVKDLRPLLEVLTQSILPAINAKGGKDWKFKAVIGWTGHNEPKKFKGSRVSAKNKPTKKRNRGKRD